jgi:hypothetical protein
MRIGSVSILASALCGLCLACGGEEATSLEASASSQAVEEAPTPGTPEFAIQKLSPRKVEARDAVEARLSRVERRLEKRRNGQEPPASDEVAELESKTAEAREILDEMKDVRGAEWDRLLVEVERTVEDVEEGLGG